MHQSQSLLAVHRCCRHSESLEIVEDIGFDALQTGLGNSDVCCFDTESQILSFDQTVIATGKLIAEHLCIFLSNIVEIVTLGRDLDALTVGILICRHVHERQLEFHGAVKVVQEVTPALEDGRLIFILVELIVDILELDSFSEIAGFYTANAVRPHSLERNTVLRRLFLLVLVLSSRDSSFNLLSFGPRELSLG